MGAHTADCIVEAWGPDRVSCLAEAVRALVEVFAAVDGVPVARSVPVSLPPGPDDQMLVALLEEVLFVVDAFGEVPVGVHLEPTAEGGVTGVMDVAPSCSVTLVGPVPKAVSYHQLQIQEIGGEWRCRAIVDV